MLPGRWAGGFRAWDDDGVYLATGRGVDFGRLLKVPATDLRDLIEEWLPLAVHLVRGVFGTARTIEATVRQREALVTLGTLSAGLAHELNNPAAAAVRTVGTMGTTLDGLLASLGQLAQGAITAEQFLALERLREQLEPADVTRSPMQIADAEEELGEWLEDHDLDDPWPLAATLAGAGVPVAWCEQAADLLPGRALEAGLAWVAGTLSVTAQLGELREATGRVSELVSAVRSYTQMDRAALQPVNVAEGLTSTLVMLQHKLKDGVKVVRDLDPDLPRIDAYAGELNQVWTNLIDNAVDAMERRGHPAHHHARPRTTRSSSRSPTPGPGSPTRPPPAPSTRSSRPRTSARAPASASTSPAASSSSATRAPSSWSARATRRWRGSGCPASVARLGSTSLRPFVGRRSTTSAVDGWFEARRWRSHRPPPAMNQRVPCTP